MSELIGRFSDKIHMCPNLRDLFPERNLPSTIILPVHFGRNLHMRSNKIRIFRQEKNNSKQTIPRDKQKNKKINNINNLLVPTPKKNVFQYSNFCANFFRKIIMT